MKKEQILFFKELKEHFWRKGVLYQTIKSKERPYHSWMLVMYSTHIILLEVLGVLEGVPGRQDDVLEELPVRERRDLVVRPEVGGELPHGRGADPARVDPLWLDGHGVGGVGVAAGALLQGSAQHPAAVVLQEDEEGEDVQAFRD